MAKDIKQLEKIITDQAKRLKLAEDRIKVLSDSLTQPKDIQKMLEVLDRKWQRDQSATDKEIERSRQLSEKLYEAERKHRDKEDEKFRKEMDKMNKDFANQTELDVIKARLANVEKLVQAALAK